MFFKFRNICFGCAVLWATEAAAVNLAVMAPVRGDYAAAGGEIISGVRAAVDEINNNGGLNGEKINLIEVEDECNDSLAVSTAQMMALNSNGEYRVRTVIGPYCANRFQTVADTFAKAGIFQIIPTGISESYADSTHSGLVKTVAYGKQQAKDFFEFYDANFNWLPVAMIYDNNNADTAQAVQNEFVKHQKTENLHLYNYGEFGFDYNRIAAQALTDNTKAAFILGERQDIAQMASELKSQKKRYKILTDKYQVGTDLTDTLGSAADGLYFMGLPSPTENPEFAETMVKLRLKGLELNGLAIYGYAAVNLWVDLAQKAGSFDYNKLSSTLKSPDFNSEWGKLMFANGNLSNNIKYSVYQYKNGEYAQVY